MCEKGYSLWPISISCQSPFGYCSIINSTLSPSTPSSNSDDSSLSCICREGFSHDLAILRFRDCRLPVMFFPVVDGLFVIAALVSLLYSSYYVREAKSIARYIICSTIALELCGLLLGAIRYANDHKMVAGTVFLFYLCMTFGCLCMYLSSYSMAQPLYKMSTQSISRLQLSIKVSFIFFRVIGFIPIIISATKFNDFNNEKQDLGWNMSAAIDSTIFGFEIVAIIISNIIHGFNMVHTIEKLSKELHATGTRAASTQEYLKRVKRYLNLIMFFSPIVAILALSMPVIYFASGYFPYQFVVFGSSEFIILFFAIKQTNFAVSSKINVGSQPSNDNSPANTNQSASNQQVVVVPTNSPSNNINHQS